MSLAQYAAPFEDKVNNKIINNNKNIKSAKVSSILNKIHNNMNDCDLESFTPPPKTLSAGVEKTIQREGMSSMDNDDILEDEYTKIYKESMSNLNDLSNKRFDQPDINYINTIPPTYHNKNDLEIKVNKILKLLESQRDYKTQNVTEELILYSFFGIFIIYVIDSFKTVGKYTR